MPSIQSTKDIKDPPTDLLPYLPLKFDLLFAIDFFFLPSTDPAVNFLDFLCHHTSIAFNYVLLNL